VMLLRRELQRAEGGASRPASRSRRADGVQSCRLDILCRPLLLERGSGAPPSSALSSRRSSITRRVSSRTEASAIFRPFSPWP